MLSAVQVGVRVGSRKPQLLGDFQCITLGALVSSSVFWEVMVLQVVVKRNKCDNVGENDMRPEKQQRHCGLTACVSKMGCLKLSVYPVVLTNSHLALWCF